MTGKSPTRTEALRMLEQDFDRIMRDALQVNPEDAKPPKKAKAKSIPRKKKAAQ